MNKFQDKSILIIGGHLTPAISVCEELSKRKFNNLHWVGVKKTMMFDKNFSFEFLTVIKHNIPFYNIITGKVIRFWNIKSFFLAFWNLFKIFFGFINSIYLLLKINPNIIISFGGYLAVPIVITGKIFRKKIITHEQTAVFGLANKIISRFSDIICISWENSNKYINLNKKIILTGNPIRKDVLEVKSNIINTKNNLKNIFVYGGNQGSHIINQLIFEMLPSLLDSYNVIHQTGSSTITNDYKQSNLFQNKCKNLKGKYFSFEHIFEENIGEIYNKSDLMISRAGANTITEIIILNKKCILIPIPWSINNEQMKNAQLIKSNSIIIEQKNLTGDILLKNINKLVSSKTEINPSNEYIFDADKRIADIVENLLK